MVSGHEELMRQLVRGRMHDRLRMHSRDWHRWVFDQMTRPDTARVLEVGCGIGMLWVKNANRIPKDWSIVISDISPILVGEAKRALEASEIDCTGLVFEAENIPFGDKIFDLVIANHVLYQVKHLTQALAQIQRVLKPRGRFYASTGTRADIFQLRNLLSDCGVNASAALPDTKEAFNLDNGETILKSIFRYVSLKAYPDTLSFYDGPSLLEYIRLSSGASTNLVVGVTANQLCASLDKLLLQLTFQLDKRAVLFEAQN